MIGGGAGVKPTAILRAAVADVPALFRALPLPFEAILAKMEVLPKDMFLECKLATEGVRSSPSIPLCSSQL
jgi:hypothetical protein